MQLNKLVYKDREASSLFFFGLSLGGSIKSRLFKWLSTGEFWVDPNEGITEDAIKVYCDFSFNATCLYSSKEKKVFTNVVPAMKIC